MAAAFATVAAAVLPVRDAMAVSSRPPSMGVADEGDDAEDDEDDGEDDEGGSDEENMVAEAAAEAGAAEAGAAEAGAAVVCPPPSSRGVGSPPTSRLNMMYMMLLLCKRL